MTKLHQAKSQTESLESTIQIQLSSEEKAWLAAHKDIRLGVDPTWPPFEFFDTTKVYSGIASDYVRRLNENLKINMAPVPNLSWSEVINKAKAGEIDVLPCVTKTPERSKFLIFSEPYISFPMVILTREDAPFVNGVQDFKNGKVAVVKGYVSQELLQRDYPGREFYLAKDIDEALRAVSRGKIDAFVGNLASITYATQKLGLTNLKVATTTPYKYELAFAVRKDWPELANILNKSIYSIPYLEKSTIQNRWINVRFERKTNWTLLLQVVGVIVLFGGIILMIILRWNRALSKEVAERKLAEEALRASRATARGLLDATKESLLLLDKDGIIIAVNRTAAARHQQTPEELIGKNRFDILPPNLRKSRKAHFKNVLLTGNPEDFEDVRDGMVFHHIYYPVRDKDGTIMGVAIFAQDITERKQAEEAVRESEINMRTIFENSPLGMIHFSKDGTILDCNDMFVNLMGSSREKLIGFNTPKQTNDEKLRAAIIKALAGETAEYEGDYTSVTGNKTASLRIVFNPTEPGTSPTEVIATLEDITERKRAEEAIRESQERLSTILKTTNQGFWLVDNDTVTLDVNEAMCEILGLRKDEIIGSNFFDFLDEENREIVREQNRMRKKGIHSLYEISLIRADGRQVPCLMNASPLIDADGNVVGSFCMTTNIAERKQMEEELRRNVDELERFSKVAYGREKKMIQLKQEINELMVKLGKDEKYKVVS